MSDPFQNMLPNLQIPYCQIHNLPGMFVNPDINNKQRPFLCADFLTNHRKIEDQIKDNQKIFQDVSNENKQKQIFQIRISNEFTNYQIKQHKIDDQVNQIIKTQTQQNELFIQSKYMDFQQTFQVNEVHNQSLKEFNKKIALQLKIIKQNINSDKFISSWLFNEPVYKDDNNKFQFSQVIYSIQQNDYCYVIALNSNNSVVSKMDSCILNMSLSESNKKLITEFEQSLVLIENVGNQWQKTSIIQTFDYPGRLSFINDKQFAVQLINSPPLLIFDYDQEDNQFKLSQLIQIKQQKNDSCFFQMQYIKSKGMLIDKNCKYINILRKQQNGEFTLDETIEFKDAYFYGSVSDDGKYLLVWERNQKQIQVRKLEII